MSRMFLIVISCVCLNATEWEINSGNFYYTPSVLEINVGDNVTWINDGGFHDVNATVNAVTGFVYDNPELFTFPPTSGSVIGSYTFNTPGTYNYNCSVGSHASMGQTGTIIVLESNATSWEIDAGNYYYSPSSLEINVGDNVTWNNLGGFHDVVVTSGPELLELPGCPGPCVIGTLTFNTAGTYEYICSIGSHAANGMVATINVVNSSSIAGCMDPNAITCDDDINPLYFPECNTCSDDSPCENYYNPEATEDNGLCMYNDVPSYEEFLITHPNNDGVFVLDWSSFSPPVSIDQYVLQRCVDTNGDSDGDGELEYENCVMVIDQFAGFLGTSYNDDYQNWEENHSMKYTFNVDYPNNNYWGSAQGIYYYEDSEPEVLLGDVNSDGIINVIDIVNLVNYILSDTGNIDVVAADFNQDNIINVIDIVNLVNFILS